MTKSRRWTIIAVVAFVAIVAIGWFGLVKPVKTKIAGYKDQALQQQSANALLLTQIQALEAEQSQLPQQQLLEDQFSNEVPDTAAEPTLIRQLSATANGAGVDLATITPGNPAQLSAPTATGSATLGSAATPTSGGLYSLPVTLAVAGSYANIESFFNGLERLPRALLVSAFSLSPGATSATGGQSLTASLTASVFFAPGTAPLTVPTPAATSTPATTTPGTATTPGATTPTAPATTAPVS